MKPVKCEKCKKFFDADKYENCPHCKAGNEVGSFSVKKEASSSAEKIEEKAENQEESFRHRFFSKLNKSESEQMTTQEENKTEKTDEETIDIYSNSEDEKKVKKETESKEKAEEKSSKTDEEFYDAVSDIAKPHNTQEEIIPIAQAVKQAEAIQNPADQKTIAFYNFSNDIEPVVGWLVCIRGEYHGASFNLKSGRNSIGRALTMDIALAQEKSVSRERHASVTFDPQQKKFFVQSGENRGLTYVNGELLMSFKELNPYDVISLGACKLMFLPLCGENFDWEDHI